MREVLISIKPKWCELIASGKKTVEVRKTKPKLETPFKVYIYCTKQGKQFFHGGIGEKECLFKNPDTEKIKFDYSFELMCCKNEYTKDNFLSGKVIGEFVCDRVDHYTKAFFDEQEARDTDEIAELLDLTCLTYSELCAYVGLKDFYGWHISDLVIYDKPRELSEFKMPDWYADCEKCNYLEKMRCPVKDSHKADIMATACRRVGKPITRPPMSWQFCVATEPRQTAD
jgi:predicted transcriptional regulator